MTIKSRFSHLRNAALSSKLSFPPGHYYSPICDPVSLMGRYREIRVKVELLGIELNEAGQLNRLLSWKQFLSDCHFPEMRAPPWRYYFGDKCQYPIGDARSLYCFIRELQPRQIVEVGCGFSSACILDTIEQSHFDTGCTFIDPEPGNLFSVLNPVERNVSIIDTPVQDVPLRTFECLESGDILFIDSTHVLKTCSDVCYELFEILPRLKPGVFVHFHDVHYPFEYPSAWVIERNYSWNEIYALRALLMYSSKFTIEFWNDYLAVLGHDLGHGASLWIRVQS